MGRHGGGGGVKEHDSAAESSAALPPLETPVRRRGAAPSDVGGAD